MFTYVCLGSDDLARAIPFYDAALGALGLTRCNTQAETDWDGWVGWGTYADGGRQEVATVAMPTVRWPASDGR